MKKQRVLMCPPDYFGVDYEINPWMKGQIGLVNKGLARQQWDRLYEQLAEQLDIHCLAPQENMPDLVFTANGGLSLGTKVLLSRFRMQERQVEEKIFQETFCQLNYEVIDYGSARSFEGEGDALFQANERLLWTGYGVRSGLEVQKSILQDLEVDVVPLRLIDPRFYHLDTCFAPLEGGEVVYFPDAFDSYSINEIESRIPPKKRILVSEEDACQFSCNLFNVNRLIFTNAMSLTLQKDLEARGYQIKLCPVSEFMKAGGGVKCLTMKLEQESIVRAPQKENLSSPIRSETLKFSGHLLDSGQLADSLNFIELNGLSFNLSNFTPALRQDQKSHAELKLCSPDSTRLENTRKALIDRGWKCTEDREEAMFFPAPKDGVAPEGFYTTSIYPTQVYINSKNLHLQNRRMDGVIVFNPAQQSITCKIIRDLDQGDLVLIGEKGLQLESPQQSDDAEAFSFMSSSVSSERRAEGQIKEIAQEIRKIKATGGKIAVVAGPVVVHTGAANYLEKMIRANFIDVLLSGNALAVHDIEYQLFETSLGVDLQKGSPVAGGHQHHLRAINRVRLAGSIEAAVHQGLIKAGIMHACVQHGVNYVLAGSIRDDGPLPDTIMDLLVAQERYSEAIKDCQMILMLSSMLHSIGVGNMTPSGVQLICVDINPAVVSKLSDRGSLEARGIVTDVGLFLQCLSSELNI